jgi:hypothetical protein
LVVAAKQRPEAEEGLGRGPKALTSVEGAMVRVTIVPATALRPFLSVFASTAKGAKDRSLSVDGQKPRRASWTSYSISKVNSVLA